MRARAQPCWSASIAVVPRSEQRAFQVDATNLSAAGFKPVAQQWAQGSWGAGAFIVALLLCLVIVGLFAFLYLLIVKLAAPVWADR